VILLFFVSLFIAFKWKGSLTKCGFIGMAIYVAMSACAAPLSPVTGLVYGTGFSIFVIWIPVWIAMVRRRIQRKDKSQVRTANYEAKKVDVQSLGAVPIVDWQPPQKALAQLEGERWLKRDWLASDQKIASLEKVFNPLPEDKDQGSKAAKAKTLVESNTRTDKPTPASAFNEQRPNMDTNALPYSETGMPTVGYVGITIGVLGAIATFSVYGTPFAIILALPAVILCTKAHRIYKSRFHKASGALVVLLVLNWIGTVISGICVLLALGLVIWWYGFQNRTATAGPISSNAGQHAVASLQDNAATASLGATLGRIYARGLNASAAELGSADVSLVGSLGKEIAEMSAAEGKLIKTWGTGVGSEDAFMRDAPSLVQAWTSASAKACIYQAGISDLGARRFLGDLLDAESRVCGTYRQLYSSVVAGDYDAANRNITTLNVVKKQKGDLYFKMIAGMREVGAPQWITMFFRASTRLLKSLGASEAPAAGTPNGWVASRRSQRTFSKQRQFK
jgi:hypothetical protein